MQAHVGSGDLVADRSDDGDVPGGVSHDSRPGDEYHTCVIYFAIRGESSKQQQCNGRIDETACADCCAMPGRPALFGFTGRGFWVEHQRKWHRWGLQLQALLPNRPIGLLTAISSR